MKPHAFYHGADVTAKTRDGSTPLHFASRGGHKDVARILLQSGADLAACDNTNRIPSQVAVAGDIVVLYNHCQAMELISVGYGIL